MKQGFVKLSVMLGTVLVLGVVVLLTRNAFATNWEHEDNKCTYTCPTVHYEWTTKVYDNCPSGYSVRQGHSDECRKNSYPFTVINRPSHNVVHSVDVKYDKSQDPNKCHRPSDNDLEDDYGMDQSTRNDFKQHNSEWKESMKVCVSPTVTVTPTPSETVTPTPTIDPCLEGDLVEVTVNFADKEASVEHLCPTPTATPSATPTPEEKHEEHHDDVLTNNTTSVPVCQDGNTINLPANPHVYRNGSEATVNWFQTEGNLANIYYKEVNAGGWQHAVRDFKVDNADHFGSVTIHDLDPNLGYTFGIQQHKGCGGGETVVAVIVDGPASQLFQFNYWEWMK